MCIHICIYLVCRVKGVCLLSGYIVKLGGKNVVRTSRRRRKEKAFPFVCVCHDDDFAHSPMAADRRCRARGL